MVTAPAPPTALHAATPPLAPGDHWSPATLRRAAYLSAGAGVLTGGVALGFYFVTRPAYERWQTNEAMLKTETPGTPQYHKTAVDQNQLASSLNNANHTILGFSIAAGLLIGTGATLFYVARASEQPATSRSLSVALSDSSAGLAWSGTW
jgi:hypothetical protein